MLVHSVAGWCYHLDPQFYTCTRVLYTTRHRISTGHNITQHTHPLLGANDDPPRPPPPAALLKGSTCQRCPFPHVPCLSGLFAVAGLATCNKDLQSEQSSCQGSLVYTTKAVGPFEQGWGDSKKAMSYKPSVRLREDRRGRLHSNDVYTKRGHLREGHARFTQTVVNTDPVFSAGWATATVS